MGSHSNYVEFESKSELKEMKLSRLVPYFRCQQFSSTVILIVAFKRLLKTVFQGL